MSEKKEYFNAKNEYHRTDGPAVSEYYEDGPIAKEVYCVNGKVHRDGGPAVIGYYG